MPHLVDAFHLPDHQLRIADHSKRSNFVFGGIAQRGDKALILGIVVGVVAKVFAQLGHGMTRGIVDSHAITGGPRVTAGSAIDVCRVIRWDGFWSTHFRSTKKIAGVRRSRRHDVEFTTAVFRPTAALIPTSRFGSTPSNSTPQA